MGVITIHSVDDGLVEEITKLAEANNHSLEQELVSLIHEGLLQRARDRDVVEQRGHASRVEIANRIAAMTPKDVKQTDSVVLIREDRDRCGWWSTRRSR